MNNKFNINLKYILIVAVLASVAAGIIDYQYNLISKIFPLISIANTTPQPTPNGTADWDTYRNEKYGFEFEYPTGTDWKIEEFKSTSSLYKTSITLGSNGCIWISLIDNPGNLSVGKYYEEYYRDFTKEDCNLEDGPCECLKYGTNLSKINIAGKEAFYCSVVPGPIGTTVIFFSANNSIFRIGKIYTDEEYEGPCKSLNTNKVFDHIISTFQLIK